MKRVDYPCEQKHEENGLKEATGNFHYQMYKLANDKSITTDIIGVICTALEVEPNNIMEFVSDSKYVHFMGQVL